MSDHSEKDIECINYPLSESFQAPIYMVETVTTTGVLEDSHKVSYSTILPDPNRRPLKVKARFTPTGTAVVV
jgi:hypothetical protein